MTDRQQYRRHLFCDGLLAFSMAEKGSLSAEIGITSMFSCLNKQKRCMPFIHDKWHCCMQCLYDKDFIRLEVFKLSLPAAFTFSCRRGDSTIFRVTKKYYLHRFVFCRKMEQTKP